MSSRYALENFTAGDLETLRLVLNGGSIVDWRRLHFTTVDEVDAFLRSNLFDPSNPADERRLRSILAQSVEYLRKTFRYSVTEYVASPARIQDLFLFASNALEPRLAKIACVVLKVMHTVHHVEARELLFRSRISESELAAMVDGRLRETIDRIATELPIVQFEGSAKARESIITKLLAKKENVAAQVYDRLRYRVVVRDRESVPSVVIALANELFPFNFVVPGQTQNTLLSMRELLSDVRLARFRGRGFEDDDESAHSRPNEFSGRSYRILNFIVDMPVRIDATALATRREDDEDLGRTVFAHVELQVCDETTLAANESGENSHVRYKKRQLRRVLARLSRGLVVPRRRRVTRPDV